ncbi:UNVERIFIED_CONTAM: hypothetical protein RMT77_019503 [Armadillidium vulgare]
MIIKTCSIWLPLILNILTWIFVGDASQIDKDEKKLFFVKEATHTKTRIEFVTSVVPVLCFTSTSSQRLLLRRRRAFGNTDHQIEEDLQRQARQASCSTRKKRKVLPDLTDPEVLESAINSSIKDGKLSSAESSKKSPRKFFTVLKTGHVTVTHTTISTNTRITIGVSLICSDSAYSLQMCG